MCWNSAASGYIADCPTKCLPSHPNGRGIFLKVDSFYHAVGLQKEQFSCVRIPDYCTVVSNAHEDIPSLGEGSD
jgi:hypothetical protein